jgi:hypothetical protein
VTFFLFPPTGLNDYRRTDRAKFHASLEDGILLSPDLHYDAANGTCVELSSAILEALAISAPKRLPLDYPRHTKSVRRSVEVCKIYDLEMTEFLFLVKIKKYVKIRLDDFPGLFFATLVCFM